MEQDWQKIENELNAKGTKVLFEVKHNGQVLTFVYESVITPKEDMDLILTTNLPNYVVTSTLEQECYKGDAVVENAEL